MEETMIITTTTTPPPVSTSSGAISAANADTVISDIVWSISTARQVRAEVHVTGASATARPWAVRVNLAVAPWYGSPTDRVQTNGTGVIAVENTGSLLLTGRTTAVSSICAPTTRR